MIMNEARLRSLIKRDPVAVAYGIEPNVISMEGLIYRRRLNAGTNIETPSGVVSDQRLHLLVMKSSFGETEPTEGTRITVAGTDWRCDAPELSPDLTHYIIPLLDPNG
jgi:hypothetical protein